MRGAESKNIITAKIMEIYPDAFMDNKVIRIPMVEDGEVVEIKVQLTAAKDVLGSNSVTPVATPAADYNFEDDFMNPPIEEKVEVTEEEKANVAKLLSALF